MTTCDKIFSCEIDVHILFDYLLRKTFALMFGGYDCKLLDREFHEFIA